jgi:hypothetical protein
MTSLLLAFLAFAAGNSFMGGLLTAALFGCLAGLGAALVASYKKSVGVPLLIVNIIVFFYCLGIILLQENGIVPPFFWYTSNVVFVAAFVINLIPTLVIPFSLAKKLLPFGALLVVPCLALFGPLQASALWLATLAMFWQISTQTAENNHV